MRTTLVVISLSLMALLVACSKNSKSPTQSSSSQGIPNWTSYGFTTILDSATVTPGTVDSIVSGPYDIQVPANAFTSPVKFYLLSANPTDFSANAPSSEAPILAFAFKVIDTQNDSLVGEFSNPVNITVTDSLITSQTWYYDLLTNGSYVLNSTGLQLSTGQLKHPIHGAIYAWVITVSNSTGGGYGY